MEIWQLQLYSTTKGATGQVTNEDLVTLAQGGDREKLWELWQNTQRLAGKCALRWSNTGKLSGLEREDLLQIGFIGFLSAVDAFDPERGCLFSTHLVLHLKKTFSEACGRTVRAKKDPMRSAMSLDMPLSDDESGELNLVDTIPDPGAAEQIEAVAEQDFILHRHRAVMAALDELPGELKDVVIRKFWNNEAVDTKLLRLATRKLRHPDISRELKIYQ